MKRETRETVKLWVLRVAAVVFVVAFFAAACVAAYADDGSDPAPWYALVWAWIERAQLPLIAGLIVVDVALKLVAFVMFTAPVPSLTSDEAPANSPLMTRSSPARTSSTSNVMVGSFVMVQSLVLVTPVVVPMVASAVTLTGPVPNALSWSRTSLPPSSVVPPV